MKISFKQMLAEFKTFAFKGSMIDLAVAVVIGAAFGGVIKALVDDVIMPSVSYVVTAASTATDVATKAAKEAGSVVGVTSKPSTTQSSEPGVAPSENSKPAPPAPAPAPAAAPAEKSPEKAVNIEWTLGRIKIGHFIGELINFVIIAFAVFIIVVKLLGSVMKKVGGTPAASEPTTKECPKCLSVIPIKAIKCSQCTADL